MTGAVLGFAVDKAQDFQKLTVLSLGFLICITINVVHLNSKILFKKLLSVNKEIKFIKSHIFLSIYFKIENLLYYLENFIGVQHWEEL